MRSRFAYVLALLLVAMPLGCGDDDGGTGDTPDASNIDAGPPVDAAPTSDTCGVQLAIEGMVAGFLVAFNAPDGSLIGTAITDVDGKASRDDCVADTMVSAVNSFNFGRGGNQLFVMTVAGVQPGDTVIIGRDAEPPVDPDSRAVVSSSTNTSTGVSYELTSGCSWNEMSAGVDAFLDLDSDCYGRNPGTFDVIAVSRDQSAVPPWDITSYAVATDVPFVIGDDSPATLGAWTPVTAPTKIDVTLSNPPAQAAGVVSVVDQRRDGVQFTTSQERTFEVGVDDPMSYTFEYALPHAFFDSQILGAQVSYGFAPFFGNPSLPATGVSAGMALVGAPPAASMEMDLSAILLPRLAGLFASTPHGISRPTVSWLTDGSPEEAAGIVFMFAFGPGFPNPEDSVRPRGIWVVMTPDVAAGEFTVPALPDSLAGAAPQANEPPTPIMGFMFASDIETYQEYITAGIDFDSGPPLPGYSETPPPEFELKGSMWYGQYFYDAVGCSIVAGRSSVPMVLGLFAAMAVLRRSRRRSPRR